MDCWELHFNMENCSHVSRSSQFRVGANREIVRLWRLCLFHFANAFCVCSSELRVLLKAPPLLRSSKGPSALNPRLFRLFNFPAHANRAQHFCFRYEPLIYRLFSTHYSRKFSAPNHDGR